jgi:hypothetical protein
MGQNWRDSWGRYRDERLFARDTEVAQANLYPLGKKSLDSWPDRYREWFGGPDEYRAWIQDDSAGRFPLLRSERRSAGDPLTICFGKSDWPNYVRCLNLPAQVAADDLDFRVYRIQRVILTPFFSSRRNCMPLIRIQRLIDVINCNSLNPFR